MNQPQKPLLKPYSKAELSKLYGFSWKTIKKWCSKAGMSVESHPEIFDDTIALPIKTVADIFKEIQAPEM